ncbi:MAG: helix-turn-helix domain-containing protein [Acidaminococcaceae bacterium]|nr:helix-turn-helix domain-containing protein [Acidaminococcaceae bacterium]
MLSAQIWQTDSLNCANPAEKKCYTVDDIMGILNIGRKAVHSLIRRKAFPAIRIAGVGYRIPKDSFTAWLYQE